ncbi:UNVERIFIED_CONTAM: hypothetical protein Slati_3400800 [Sesamum latifolium]|uniref:Uncharacterized protein n=1 Tax=Sesamum latifolium TaxID=2727402 RepID=A0AAW2UEI5_9LAMI
MSETCQECERCVFSEYQGCLREGMFSKYKGRLRECPQPGGTRAVFREKSAPVSWGSIPLEILVEVGWSLLG